jgi:hypothetical protein
MKIVLRLAIGAVVAACALAAVPAHAQWMWKDEGGHTIASDMPPPPNTPPSRILKSPRKTPAAEAVADAPSGDAAKAADPKADAPKSLADRELEAKKRDRERAEAAKKSDDEAVKVAAMKENCSTVRGNLAGLQAGGRAARVNEKGEKTYLDDAQRAAEVAKAQGQIAQYCK